MIPMLLLINEETEFNSLLEVSKPVSRWSHYFNPAKVSRVCVGCVRLFRTPWTMTLQAPLSMGFSRQEYWSGLSFTSPGIFPTQISPIADTFFTIWVTRESQKVLTAETFCLLILLVFYIYILSVVFWLALSPFFFLPETCTYLHVCIHISMYVLIY